MSTTTSIKSKTTTIENITSITTTEAEAADYESQHVHNIYAEIACHFSQTRYKPWPIISTFLRSLPAGSVGLDIGCGNGKYLRENRDICIFGSDMSEQLLLFAQQAIHAAQQQQEQQQQHGHNPLPPTTTTPTTTTTTTNTASTNSSSRSSVTDLLLSSTLAIPHPPSRFDFAIVIAVIHHLCTRERRVRAIREVLRCLRGVAGRALLYVWALEQESSSRRVGMGGGGSDGSGAGAGQDVMVPWVLSGSASSASASASAGVDGGGISGDGKADAKGNGTRKGDEKVLQRYYHLYRRGELEDDVLSAGGRVVEAGYERDNWWVVASR